MAANGEKVAQEIYLSTLQNDVRGLQDECRNEDTDSNNLQFDYEPLRKVWEDYLTSQMYYLSTFTTEDDLKR